VQPCCHIANRPLHESKSVGRAALPRRLIPDPNSLSPSGERARVRGTRSHGVPHKSNSSCGICILAGGLSSRMGKEKSKLRLGRRTLLSHVRAQASALGFPVRVIRRDLLPRCGPLGGINTGLKTSLHPAELFLACDMPFVSASLMKRLVQQYKKTARPIFTFASNQFGFPLLLPTAVLPTVEEQIRTSAVSLQALAGKLRARRYRVSPREQKQLLNISTPKDFARALAHHRLVAAEP